MREQWWVAEVGTDNASWLATESRTARLAREYRPRDIGDGRIEFNTLALGASRELGEEEDGFITEDGEGLRIWIGDDAFELDLVESASAAAGSTGGGGFDLRINVGHACRSKCRSERGFGREPLPPSARANWIRFAGRRLRP